MDAAAMVAHAKKYGHLYMHQVLVPMEHYRLVQDLDRVTAMANIPQQYVAKSMKTWCGDDEVQWVRTLKNNSFNGVAGMVYSGSTTHVEDRMMAITGACLRNYIDARVFTVQDVIDKMKDKSLPSPTVMLIPNFFLKKDQGGDLPSWQISSLLGLLYTRYSRQQHTILYVQDLHRLGEAYGVAFRSHLEGHYTFIDSQQ